MKVSISSSILISCFLLIIVIGCEDKNIPPERVTDIEGNTYTTVKIGDQVWTAENLRTRKFNDGSDIPLITDTLSWGGLTTPGYCWYLNNETEYKTTYGALYNGYSVATSGLCPTGWHVPSKDEWQELRDFLGDTITGGGKLKETGVIHWAGPNTGAANSTGFTALPAGIRYFEGSFSSVFYFTSFWSSTESENNEGWYLYLYFGDAVAGMDQLSKNFGFSVRCIKD